MALTGALLLVSLAVSPAQAQGQAKSRHYIIGVDRSGSRTAQQLADMRQFLDALLQQASYGDRVEIVEVLQSPLDNVRQFRDSIPALRSGQAPSNREERRKRAVQSAFRSAAQVFTDTAGISRIRHTDIFAFLTRVSDYIEPASGRETLLILLSDMIHDTPELNLSRSNAIPGATWIRQRADAGLVPSLRGACFVAVGVDVGTPRAARLKQFWFDYMRTAGAIVVDGNYRGTMSAANLRC
ncbi:MAG: hypothetical protein C0503_01195 [Gemmatimonas sp.]|nr:hypothetical protein [Gemmatimonas sp.]